MGKVFIIHENGAWLAPLRDALAGRSVPFEEWHLDSGSFALDAPPPDGVFYNRMSASSHTRGHAHAPEYTAAVLTWLKAYGRRVVNGPRALELEVSKVKQYAALNAAGVRTPRTAVAVGREAVRAAARSFGTPLIMKPNRGGKGAGVHLFATLDAADAYVDGPAYETGPDGVTLIQEHLLSPDQSIVRAEFVGGRFLYAVRVDTSGGFELCPADACRIDDLACPVGGNGSDGGRDAPPTPLFRIIDGFDHANIARYESFLAANDIEVAGIEMIFDADGTAWTYDVNTNTNYNPDAELAAGRAGTDGAGMGAVARYLQQELRKRDDGRLAAAE